MTTAEPTHSPEATQEVAEEIHALIKDASNDPEAESELDVYDEIAHVHNNKVQVIHVTVNEELDYFVYVVPEGVTLSFKG